MGRALLRRILRAGTARRPAPPSRRPSAAPPPAPPASAGRLLRARRARRDGERVGNGEGEQRFRCSRMSRRRPPPCSARGVRPAPRRPRPNGLLGGRGSARPARAAAPTTLRLPPVVGGDPRCPARAPATARAASGSVRSALRPPGGSSRRSARRSRRKPARRQRRAPGARLRVSRRSSFGPTKEPRRGTGRMRGREPHGRSSGIARRRSSTESRAESRPRPFFVPPPGQPGKDPPVPFRRRRTPECDLDRPPRPSASTVRLDRPPRPSVSSARLRRDSFGARALAPGATSAPGPGNEAGRGRRDRTMQIPRRRSLPAPYAPRPRRPGFPPPAVRRCSRAQESRRVTVRFSTGRSARWSASSATK